MPGSVVGKATVVGERTRSRVYQMRKVDRVSVNCDRSDPRRLCIVERKGTIWNLDPATPTTGTTTTTTFTNFTVLGFGWVSLLGYSAIRTKFPVLRFTYMKPKIFYAVEGGGRMMRDATPRGALEISRTQNIIIRRKQKKSLNKDLPRAPV